MVALIRFSACVLLCVLFQNPLLSSAQVFKQSEGISYSAFNTRTSPSKALLGLMARQARWDDTTVTSKNELGLRLRFVKINDQPLPGGGSVARYRIFAEGAPENKIFSIAYWPIGKKIEVDPQDIYVNGQGLLMTRKPRPEEDMIFKSTDEYVVSPITGSGEPMRYMLSRMDGQLEIYGTLVPHPVAAEEQGCRLEMRLAAPDAMAFLAVLDGFPAREKIPLVLESEGASVSETVYTDDNGHGVMADFPAVVSKTQGKLKASAEGPDCLPAVIVPWGAPPAAKSAVTNPPAATPPATKKP